MARRATSSNKGRSAASSTPPADASELMADKPARRGKSKPATPEPADMPETDTLPITEGELGSTGQEAVEKPAAKPRRGRASPMAEEASPEPDAAPSSLAAADAASTSAAAKWDEATGAATFDWPAIEAVAATTGPNQAMAKLLLAARAEGSNSRWPF